MTSTKNAPRTTTWRQRLLRATFFPTFEDDARAQPARAFHSVAWWSISIIGVFLLGLGVLEPTTLARRATSAGILAAYTLPLLWLNHRGRTRLASWLLVLGFGGIVTWRSYSAGGFQGSVPTGVLFVYICMVSGTLLGTRAGAFMAALLAGIGLGFGWLYESGRLPPPELTYNPFSNWLYFCMALALSVVLYPQITRVLAAALKRAQDEVSARHDAEHRLRIALDAGGIGVWESDPATGSLTADDRLLALYEIDRPEDGAAISLDVWLARIHPEDRPEFAKTFEALASGTLSSAEREFRIVLPGGGVRHVLGAGSAITNERGVVHRIVGVNRDVTDRRRAEEERAELVHALGERVKELRLLHRAAWLLQGRTTDRELFQKLVQSIPAAWQYPAVCEARITYRDIEVATPGYRTSEFRQAKPFTTSEGAGLIEVVYLERPRDGADDPFLVEEWTLLDSLAEILVSHLELRKHQEHLELLVSTRTREMQQAKEEAERASRAKTKFLATMSHEIRTPMNAILGYAQLLRRDAQLAPAQQRPLDTILASGEHLLTLINDVLEMSRIEAGRTELSPEAVDLPALLDGIQQMFAALARSKHLDLTFDLAPDLPRLVEADPGKVRQVVINVVSNAIKFTSQGGVFLRATVDRVTEHGHRIRVVVDDTGPGIDEADLERVFGTFEQTTTGPRGGGTGLGLSIGRHLARMMGGDLVAARRAGCGSTFDFTFDVGLASSEARAKLERGRILGVKSGASPKVLVVDDVADNVNLAVGLFRAVGFDAHGASSAEAGLVLYERLKPDIVLMDLRMPGIGGLEAIRRLRASGSTTVLVAFTASGFDDLTNAALASGANDVLSKPYRESELLEKVARLLGLELVHESDPPAVLHAPEEAPLGPLFRDLPPTLRAQLREAVAQARAQRIASLASEIDAIHPDAARAIRRLARDFRYDDLAAALTDPS